MSRCLWLKGKDAYNLIRFTRFPMFDDIDPVSRLLDKSLKIEAINEKPIK